MTETRKPRAVVVSDNLLDRARIEEAARAAGWEPVAWTPDGVQVDLALVDLESSEATAAIMALGIDSKVVAFGPHVNTEGLAAAERLGAEALSRSRFFSGLTELFVV